MLYYGKWRRKLMFVGVENHLFVVKGCHFITCFFVLLLGSCSGNSTHPVQFYTWKSSPDLGEKEQQFFKETGVNKL